MLSMYPACFFREENGYSVIFPDLDLATCGETMTEAMEMDINFSQVLQEALIAKVHAR